MAKLLRLDKILADTGKWSRKEAKELIKQGRVSCNGLTVKQGEQKADPDRDQITVDHMPLNWSEYTYLMLHKPAGYLTSTEDPRDPTVMELIPKELRKRGLAPVGRLDKDTTGLLLLTDHGALAHELLSPRHHVDKTYLACVEGTNSQADCQAFEEGILLGDGTRCMPAKLEILAPGQCLVTVREGKYHQVKRMLASRGTPVKTLKRLTMGPLTLDESLLPGQCRRLTKEEEEALVKSGSL